MTITLVLAAPDGARLLHPDGRPFFAVIVNYHKSREAATASWAAPMTWGDERIE